MGKDWYPGCWEDQKWRLNHLYWIETKDGVPVRFQMNWAQEDFFDNMWWRNNILKARQLGMSTLIAILILDGCLFNEGWHAGINDKKMEDAKAKLGKIRYAHDAMKTPPRNGVDHVEDEDDRRMINAYAQKIHKLMCGKVTKTMGVWNNGSTVEIGTELRSKTLQFLHISELGHVSANYPQKAENIRDGSLPCVEEGKGIIVMESTHEGGKVGVNYEMTRNAMECVGRKLAVNEYRFFFYAWWGHPGYRTAGGEPVRMDSELQEYFEHLEADEGIFLDDEQKRWYVGKVRVHGGAVQQEYPSTPEEAFEVKVEGAIYGSMMMAARAQGRMKQDFYADPDYPLYVSWDLGMRDETSMWLIQVRSDAFYVLDYYTNCDQADEHYIAVVRAWETRHGQSIKTNFLPHDGAREDPGKVTYAQRLRRQGLNCVVLPRTSDRWIGIREVRRLLPRCIFHENCSESRGDFMSGVGALENYRKAPIGKYGVQRDEPLHNEASHLADAFRYFAEAHMAGLVDRHGGALPNVKRLSGAQKGGNGNRVRGMWG